MRSFGSHEIRNLRVLRLFSPDRYNNGGVGRRLEFRDLSIALMRG